MLTEVSFAAGSLVILVAGANLARYGEAVAEKTRVSVTWVGLVLVAVVTSLPELFSGVGSVLVLDEPDLAAGDVLGSCIFNLSLAAAALLFLRRTPTRPNDHDVYRVGAWYATLMLLAVAAGMGASARPGTAWAAGVASALLVVLYLAAVRHVFRVQTRRERARDVPPRFAGLGMRRLMAIFAANAILVIGAATLLPYLAQSIASERGLATSFVGTALLAASTSLPELVVTLAAIRQGVPSLAIGGLVGSNLFDLLVLAIDDLLYAEGPILAAIAPAHATTVALVIVATWSLVLALPPRKRPRVAWLLVVLAACAGALLLSAGGSGYP